MELKKIASFQVDHRGLPKGVYLSRRDGDIDTWDLRTRLPNAEAVMENAAIHSMEHLAATYLRSSPYSESIIYFGPMGCRTGFYLLTRGLSAATLLPLLQDCFRFIAAYTGPVPGVSEAECGNYREHDLAGAKAEASLYLPVLLALKEDRLKYPS